MNRGSHVRLGKDNKYGIASMRPRFMNRGSNATWIVASLSTRCFNEAPIHESGKSELRMQHPTLRLPLQ